MPQKYRSACKRGGRDGGWPRAVGAVWRYAPEFSIGVGVAKYAHHLPRERQVCMMARGLRVELKPWEQTQALARQLEPTRGARGTRACHAGNQRR